jgi:hypothetical protein
VASDAPGDETSEQGRDASEPATDALQRLEERLDRASRAAERLIAQARAEVASAGKPDEPPRAGTGMPPEEPASAESQKPPPAGWQSPESSTQGGGDLELLAQLIQSMRDLLPPDLQRRLADAVRELLLALRALIDFYLERIERRTPAPARMEDIPIS